MKLKLFIYYTLAGCVCLLKSIILKVVIGFPNYFVSSKALL